MGMIVQTTNTNGISNFRFLSLGQGIKDIVCWPRPACPPVFRLQSKWALEYGMPSTHAMVGVSIPFSVILYTMNRYQVIAVKVFIKLYITVLYILSVHICVYVYSGQ